MLQFLEHDADLGRGQRAIPGDEGRDRGGGHVVGRVADLLAVENGETVDLLDDVANMDGRRRRAAILHLVTERPHILGCDLVSIRSFHVGRMSRSKIVLRIDRVLSPICASLSQRLPTSLKLAAGVRCRFLRCLSSAGDCPSVTSFLAAVHRSLASDRPMPSGP